MTEIERLSRNCFHKKFMSETSSRQFRKVGGGGEWLSTKANSHVYIDLASF